MDNLGLNKEDIEAIISVIEKQTEVEQAIIFGSRAKGNYRRGSDVDIALKGNNVTRDITSQVSYLLNEETQMPYHFDVLNYNSIHNKELTSHIQRVGILVYNTSPRQ